MKRFHTFARTGWVVVSLGAASQVALAANTVGGIIRSNTHWMAGTGPFIVDQSIVVTNKATLTIDPGVEVRFKPGRGIVIDSGELIARGTDTSKIKFTADVADVSTISNADRWGFIRFADGAADARFDHHGAYTEGSIIEHAIVEGAGHHEMAALQATRAKPFVSKSLIQGNAGAGIRVESASEIRISGNTVTNNAGAGIFASGAFRVRITDNTATGNLFGIQLLSTSSALVLNNTLIDNSGSGIDSRADFLATISHNTVNGTGQGSQQQP